MVLGLKPGNYDLNMYTFATCRILKGTRESAAKRLSWTHRWRRTGRAASLFKKAI